MNIIQPYSKLVFFDEEGDQQEFTPRHGIGLLRKIEWNARISHRSEDKQTRDSWDNFIRRVVLEHGDWSVVEHASVTVDTTVDRGITHEWVRHRLFSFTQESTRFVNYEKKMPALFVMPDLNEAQRISWERNIEQAELSYKEMISQGCAPQIARSVFPNALASRISTTGNLRTWRHFLLMRTTKEAHPQIRQVTIPLLEQFKACIPILFSDIEPLARQVDNLKKPR